MFGQSTEFGSSRYHEHQVVVAIPHLRTVLHRIEAELGTPVDRAAIDADEQLGLALVPLPDAELERWAAANTPAGAAAAPAPLDALLAHLYQSSARDHGGWVPTIGKNRAVDEVGGNHTIGVGDEGFPVGAKDVLPPRNADPGAGVLVGVADTVLHPSEWLTGAYQAPPASVWRQQDAPAGYETGHASFVVGMVLQEAPGARTEVRQVLGDDGFADSWSVAKALVRFQGLGVEVLNLSLGCFTHDNRAPLVLEAALDRLDPDIVVVAAAGNHAARAEGRRPLWPAALPRVVAVGAMDAARAVPKWSPEPGGWPWVDVLATGSGVTSTYITGPVDLGKERTDFDGFATWSGTSFAAAKLSGAIAARTVPGRVSAATALRELLRTSTGEDGVPRIV
jgi:hypothetical protein